MGRVARDKRPQGFTQCVEALSAYISNCKQAVKDGWRRAVALVLTVVLTAQMLLSSGFCQAVSYAYAEEQAQENQIALMSGDSNTTTDDPSVSDDSTPAEDSKEDGTTPTEGSEDDGDDDETTVPQEPATVDAWDWTGKTDNLTLASPDGVSLDLEALADQVAEAQKAAEEAEAAESDESDEGADATDAADGTEQSDDESAGDDESSADDESATEGDQSDDPSSDDETDADDADSTDDCPARAMSFTRARRPRAPRFGSVPPRPTALSS